MANLVSTERWSPKGPTWLDSITTVGHPFFRYILVRNGHNVALYGGKVACESDLKDRQWRFPADDWAIIDRRPVQA